MAAPITRHQTFLILEAGRGLDERQCDNFYDHVAGSLQHCDPTDDEVKQAIRDAKRALRISELN
jgi:hypothetical protein